jgi:hypothetical protein
MIVFKLTELFPGFHETATDTVFIFAAGVELVTVVVLVKLVLPIETVVLPARLFEFV